MNAERPGAGTGSLEELASALRRFADARDWDQFHAPKNLAMALSVEVAELLEHFQWLGDEESRRIPADEVGRIAEEMADVLLYLVRLADKLDVDLLEAAARKLESNEKRYPVERARGSRKKYDAI